MSIKIHAGILRILGLAIPIPMCSTVQHFLTTFKNFNSQQGVFASQTLLKTAHDFMGFIHGLIMLEKTRPLIKANLIINCHIITVSDLYLSIRSYDYNIKKLKSFSLNCYRVFSR